MKDVYQYVPTFENEKWLLKQSTNNEIADLLEVYSDKLSLPLFNSDNCHGDKFHYDTLEKMDNAIKMWDESYNKKHYVRWTIFSKKENKAIGTIELFHRKAKDYFDNVGLLRIDLKSEYEKEEFIIGILGLIINDTYEMFECDRIATKAISTAKERINALIKLGFVQSVNNLIGHDGTNYDSYFEIRKG